MITVLSCLPPTLPFNHPLTAFLSPFPRALTARLGNPRSPQFAFTKFPILYLRRAQEPVVPEANWALTRGRRMMNQLQSPLQPLPAIGGAWLRMAWREKIVLVDDDICYDLCSLGELLDWLNHAEVIRRQNYFHSQPWWARIEEARMRINRATLRATDYPGTCAFRRTTGKPWWRSLSL